MSTEKVKKTFEVEKRLLERLDNWIKWQKEHRDYDVDESHVINVLLHKFIQKNADHLDSAELELDM